MNTGWHHKNTRKDAHAGVIIPFTIFCIYCWISLEQHKHRRTEEWMPKKNKAKQEGKKKQENVAQHTLRIDLTNPPQGLAISQPAQMS